MTAVLLAAWLAVVAFEYGLEALNLRHLRRHGHEVPPEFAGAIDAQRLATTCAYTLDLKRVGLAESLLENLLLFLFLFVGLGVWYDRWVAGFTDSFVFGGILFFALLTLAKALIGLPFGLYRTFVIEERYGFNAMTWRLWLSDLLKATAISAILLALLVGGAFWLVQASPDWWWLWVWAFFALFTLFFMLISPYLIEPLFFTFEPVREKGLEGKIRDLMARAGLEVSRVFQVDASRRSKHSNAYFTGIGRVKRIVLFDTLLEQMNHDEIIAVLAHEVGHWKKRHIFKRLAATELIALLGAWLAYRLLEWGGLPGLLGLSQASFSLQLVILSLLFGLAAFPLTPLASWRSRRHEREADDFACTLCGAPQALASGLIKLSRENLANLHPHPWYAAFHYSHPPVVARVRSLLRRGANIKGPASPPGLGSG